MSSSETFSCLFCKETFDDKETLQIHFRKHGDPNFNQNPRTKASKIDIKEKAAVDPKSEFVNCDVCDEVFPTISKAITHKHKVHPNHDAKYFCHWCGKLFTMKHLFNKHMMSHKSLVKGDNTFHCDCCDVDFYLVTAMLYHNKFFHRQDTELSATGHSKKQKHFDKELVFVYYCPFCGEEYINKVNLHKHIGDDHSDENQSPMDVLRCPLCEAIFYHLDAYEVHLTFHSSDDIFNGSDLNMPDVSEFTLDSVPPIMEKVQLADQDLDVNDLLQLATNDDTQESTSSGKKKHKKKKHKKSKKEAITLDEFLSMNQDVFGEGLDFQGIEEVPTKVISKRLKMNPQLVCQNSTPKSVPSEVEQLKLKGIIVKRTKQVPLSANEITNIKPVQFSKELTAQLKQPQSPKLKSVITEGNDVLTKLLNQSNSQIVISKKSVAEAIKTEEKSSSSENTKSDLPFSDEDLNDNKSPVTNDDCFQDQSSQEKKTGSSCTDDEKQSNQTPNDQQIKYDTKNADIFKNIGENLTVKTISAANETPQNKIEQYSNVTNNPQENQRFNTLKSMGSSVTIKSKTGENNADDIFSNKDRSSKSNDSDGTESEIENEISKNFDVLSDKEDNEEGSSVAEKNKNLGILKNISQHLTVKPVSSTNKPISRSNTDNVEKTNNSNSLGCAECTEDSSQQSILNKIPPQVSVKSTLPKGDEIEEKRTHCSTSISTAKDSDNARILNNLSSHLTVKSNVNSNETLTNAPPQKWRNSENKSNNVTVKPIKLEQNAKYNRQDENNCKNEPKTEKSKVQIQNVQITKDDYEQENSETNEMSSENLKTVHALKQLSHLTIKPSNQTKKLVNVDQCNVNLNVKTQFNSPAEDSIKTSDDLDSFDDEDDKKNSSAKCTNPKNPSKIGKVVTSVNPANVRKFVKNMPRQTEYKIHQGMDKNNVNSETDLYVIDDSDSDENSKLATNQLNMSKNNTAPQSISTSSDRPFYIKVNQSNVLPAESPNKLAAELLDSVKQKLKGNLNLTLKPTKNTSSIQNTSTTNEEPEVKNNELVLYKAPDVSDSDSDPFSDHESDTEFFENKSQKKNNLEILGGDAKVSSSKDINYDDDDFEDEFPNENEMKSTEKQSILNKLKTLGCSLTVKGNPSGQQSFKGKTAINKNVTAKASSNSNIVGKTSSNNLKRPSTEDFSDEDYEDVLPPKQNKINKDITDENITRNTNINKQSALKNMARQQTSSKNTVSKHVTNNVKSYQTETVVEEVTTTVTRTIKTVHHANSATTVTDQQVTKNVPLRPKIAPMVRQNVAQGNFSTVRLSAPPRPRIARNVAVRSGVGIKIRNAAPSFIRPNLNQPRMSAPRMPKFVQPMNRPLKLSPNLNARANCSQETTKTVKQAQFVSDGESTMASQSTQVVKNAMKCSTTSNSASSSSKMQSVVSKSLHQVSKMCNVSGLNVVKSSSSHSKVVNKTEMSASCSPAQKNTLDTIERLRQQGLLVKRPRVEDTNDVTEDDAELGVEGDL